MGNPVGRFFIMHSSLPHCLHVLEWGGGQWIVLYGESRNTFFILSWPGVFVIALHSQILVTCEGELGPGDVEGGRLIFCMYAICKGLLAI